MVSLGKALVYVVGAGAVVVGAGVAGTLIGTGIQSCSYIIPHLFADEKPVQKNVLGNDLPEPYIELNGVRYYSRIDGKDISDLVNEGGKK